MRQSKFIYFKHYLEAWLHIQRMNVARRTTNNDRPERVIGAHILGECWQVRL